MKEVGIHFRLKFDGETKFFALARAKEGEEIEVANGDILDLYCQDWRANMPKAVQKDIPDDVAKHNYWEVKAMVRTFTAGLLFRTSTIIVVPAEDPFKM
jgi:hypothetical protein